ncbi:hypothetical protein CH72_4162 [Burkholderia ambifaria AMMD]|jgi:hypothetical protein|uniref:Uncharacterized protein n=1 Tax=Burkholderia ambifaria (strain ATCC BAA-244 / DSM 16087 / CCUG 44356 / LMG 19182 / AMMD) TaxID=339670 RepID=Q0B841_BURCM|nr:hypothetical protein [Burkholderia ambifaria]ABI89682.1 hypothetical protein Bamb_4129 [Burkholderia ambifaria AMMD]AJY24888.1 hypothetical protein CH72_4162 [Burkholderia ambifaria AMMD]MBR7930222.1 hypothetical protein [Burkholderia ambifaria]QQC07663.1 hypothetical protein I6H84_19540 [Burkholderia ambifaria]UZU03250.1 hypothetical protein OR987_09780 [Burkholderia ambifaria]
MLPLSLRRTSPLGAAGVLLPAFVGLVYFVILMVYSEAEAVYGPRGGFVVRRGKQVARGVGAPVIQPNGH